MRKKVCLTVVMAGLLASLVALPVLANSNDNLRTLCQDEDHFWNYDFVDEDYVGDQDHVDQPLTIVFSGNANIGKIKETFSLMGFIYEGSTMYNELRAHAKISSRFSLAVR